jgi:regulator of protease activity HflC (stomatin/prohibitin superfamily)
MKIQRVTVKKNERALLLRNGDFDRVLRPGTVWLVSLRDRLEVQRFPLSVSVFEHPIAEWLMAEAPDVIAAEFVKVALTEHEVGLRVVDGVLAEVLAPGTRALYWNAPADTRIEVIDLRERFELAPELAQRLARKAERTRGAIDARGVELVTVPEGQVGVLWVDGRLDRLLEPGAYGWWRWARDVSVGLVDLRLQGLEVSGQEMLTADKVTLRVNLTATWRYADVRTAFAQLAKPVDHLYRELQLALRAVVGTRTLDALLEDKSVLDGLLEQQVRERLAPFGLALESVGVKDVVLPGEMRTLLAQVVQAGKAAEANVIRRREETAATRSLLATAKVMEDNPSRCG